MPESTVRGRTQFIPLVQAEPRRLTNASHRWRRTIWFVLGFAVAMMTRLLH